MLLDWEIWSPVDCESIEHVDIDVRRGPNSIDKTWLEGEDGWHFRWDIDSYELVVRPGVLDGERLCDLGLLVQALDGLCIASRRTVTKVARDADEAFN